MPNQDIDKYYKRLPLRYAYQFLNANGYSEEATVIKLSQDKYKSYKSGFVTQIGAKVWAFEGFLNSGTEQ